MLLMKFDYDWPAGLRDINVLKCGRTDGRRLESHTISSPWAFGSGELKISKMLVTCCYSPLHLFSIFEWIFLILAGNNDTHKSFNELDYPLQPTTKFSYF